MRQDFQIGDIVARPGTLAKGYLQLGELSDSAPVNMPVMVIHGKHDGPVLMVSAAIHGPELTGTEVIRRLCREEINPEELRGTIVALPIANPYAFRGVSWWTPQDKINLNRAFPGATDKWLTPRIAHVLYEQIIKRVDAIVDIHCNCGPTGMFSNVKRTPDQDVSAKSLGLAQAFGLSIVELVVEDNMAHRSGTMLEAAHAIGIPGITIELEEWRRIPEAGVQVGLRGTRNVLAHLGMIDADILPQGEHVIYDGLLSWIEIFANRGGIVEICRGPKEKVAEGEVVCRIRDPFGDVLEEIKSPTDAYVLGYPIFGNQAVGTGEMLLFLGAPK